LIAKRDPPGFELRVPFEVASNRFKMVVEVTYQMLAGVARTDDFRPEQA
jgi:hypothetical protein